MERTFALEYPCPAPGQPQWFILRVTPFANPGRAHVVVAHENITERKLAEATIAREKELLER